MKKLKFKEVLLIILLVIGGIGYLNGVDYSGWLIILALWLAF